MKDAFGSDVRPGDLIAHVTRKGASMFFAEKEVLAAYDDHIVVRQTYPRDSEKQTKITARNFVVTER